MLRCLARVPARLAPASRSVAPVLSRGLASDIVDSKGDIVDFKGTPHPLNTAVGEPKVLQKDSHIFPDHVLEEEKYGFPAGLPLKRDSELWADPNDPNQLLAERAELWWDDGTAEPEWFVDRGSAGGANGGRPWAVSSGQAVAQCLGMFGILGMVMCAAVAVGDSMRPAAPSWVHSYPVDMHKMSGLSALPKDGTTAMNGVKRVEQYGVEAEEEEEED